METRPGGHSPRIVAPPGGFSFHFHVSACRLARVRLARFGRNATYEVVLGAGANARCELRAFMAGAWKTVAQVATPGVLHCNEMRPFWVGWRWGAKLIQVCGGGGGVVGVTVRGHRGVGVAGGGGHSQGCTERGGVAG